MPALAPVSTPATVAVARGSKVERARRWCLRADGAFVLVVGRAVRLVGHVGCGTPQEPVLVTHGAEGGLQCDF